MVGPLRSPHSGPRVGLVLGVVALVLAPLAAVAVVYPEPPEDYATYQPQQRCRARPLPGTAALATWVNRRFAGGTAAATMRACGSGGTSEHKDGRAIDWRMDATRAGQRAEVARFLETLFAPDSEGNPHALARRMGVMYIIWNDRMYASYNEFTERAYLSSSCPSLRRCSKTLRHRDHVHISLSRPGGRGETSWYAGRV